MLRPVHAPELKNLDVECVWSITQDGLRPGNVRTYKVRTHKHNSLSISKLYGRRNSVSIHWYEYDKRSTNKKKVNKKAAFILVLNKVFVILGTYFLHPTMLVPFGNLNFLWGQTLNACLPWKLTLIFIITLWISQIKLVFLMENAKKKCVKMFEKCINVCETVKENVKA